MFNSRCRQHATTRFFTQSLYRNPYNSPTDPTKFESCFYANEISMYKSALSLLSVFFLASAFVLIAGNTSFACDISNSHQEMPSGQAPMVDSAPANQGTSVVPSDARAAPKDQACYVRHGKTGCLEFPNHIKPASNAGFVYHGIRGEFESQSNR